MTLTTHPRTDGNSGSHKTREATMAFDPTRPVSIFNVYPERLWPFKLGHKIYYIDHRNRRASGEAPISIGRVRFYNPARKQDASYIVSVGCPFCTLEMVGSPGNAQTVGTDLIAPFTKTGKATLLAKYAHWWRTDVETARTNLAELERTAAGEIARLSVEIERLTPRGRTRKVAL